MRIRLAIVVALSFTGAGCSDKAVDSPPAPAATSSGELHQDAHSTDTAPAHLTSAAATGSAASESVPPSPSVPQTPSPTDDSEEAVLPDVQPIRVLIFTQAVPVVCDFRIVEGVRSRREVAIEASSAWLQEMSEEPGVPPTWNDVFGSPLLRLAGGMAESPPSARQRAILQRAYDRDADDTVAPAELLAYANRGLIGTDWFVLRARPPAARPRQDQTLMIVDVDEDGRLSRAETGQAAGRIWRFDADGDGIVWRGDLSPSIDRSDAPNERPLRSDEIPAAVIGEDVAWDDIYYRCERRYAASGPLELDSLATAASTMRRLDENEDGFVSRQELELLTSVEPQVVVTCDLAAIATGGSGALSVSARDTLTLSRRTPVSCAVAVDGARLNIGLQLPTDEREDGDLLRRLDSNQDELISASELSVLGLSIRFDRYDKDRSGSLDSSEFAELYKLAAAARNLRVECWLIERDDALFTCLDSNADERLDSRELQSAADVLTAADSNSDGYTDEYELSNGMQIIIKQGAGPFAETAPSFPDTSAAEVAAPPWFLQTDGNRDGFIDAIEFLGSPNQFRELDKNEDGYIQPSEIETSSFAPSK